jgi:hypothetical protein
MASSDNQLIIIVESVSSSNISSKSKGNRGIDPLSDEYNDEFSSVTEISIDAEKLKSKMSNFVKIITMVVNESQEVVGKESGMQLDEVKLTVEISGEGEFKLLGTGAKAGGKGALELVFKRRS